MGIIVPNLGNNIITMGYGKTAIPIKLGVNFALERYIFEVCPSCDCTLENNMYHNFDEFGNKHWYCKICFQELEYSSIGWVKKLQYYEHSY